MIRTTTQSENIRAVYSFVIPGPAVPYQRITQGQVKLMRIPDHKLTPSHLKVKQRLRRYFDYKDVCALVCARIPFDRSPKTKVYFNAICYFSDKKHGDCENVRKAVQDAIYGQDKMVAGFVDFHYDENNPRVECEILEPR
jgi:hypothetical protein